MGSDVIEGTETSKVNASKRRRSAGHGHAGKQKAKPTAKKSAALRRTAPGMVVGSTANEIDDSNVGNVLLKKMGWKMGHGLGKEEQGRTAPVVTLVRERR